MFILAHDKFSAMASSPHSLKASGEALDSYKHIIRQSFLPRGLWGNRMSEGNNTIPMDTSQ